MQASAIKDFKDSFILGLMSAIPDKANYIYDIFNIYELSISDDIFKDINDTKSTEVQKATHKTLETSTPDLDTEALWSRAYEFVEAAKQKIAGYARRFLPYSSYSHDEFIQQAYESAYHALEKCIEKGKPDKYEGYFWMQYLKDCYKMANIPSRKKFYEECIKSSINDPALAEEILKELSCSPITLEEYREHSEDGAPATAVASSIPDPLENAIQNEESLDNELKELIQEEMLKKALMLMTPRQRQVWEYLMGFHGSIPSLPFIGQKLGITKQMVIKLRDKGLKRAAEILSLIQKYSNPPTVDLHRIEQLRRKIIRHQSREKAMAA